MEPVKQYSKRLLIWPPGSDHGTTPTVIGGDVHDENPLYPGTEIERWVGAAGELNVEFWDRSRTIRNLTIAPGEWKRLESTP